VLHGQASLRVTLDTSDWISRRRYAMLPTPQDGTLYYRWYHKVSGDYFTDDSVAIKGNALYGWKPGQTLNYATESDGTNHFSTRASANRNMGGLHLYYYGANGNVSKGADVTTDYQPDRWTCVEIQLTPNTVTNQVADKNGEMRLWVNGRLIHSITGIVHRTTDALKLQMVDNVDRYNSGAGIPGTLVKWEDNLVVAKNRIGCMP
jgi:hypothetical protein